VEVPVRILAPRGGLFLCEERPLVHASVNLRDGDGSEFNVVLAIPIDGLLGAFFRHLYS
jgi:hypothetical protein